MTLRADHVAGGIAIAAAVAVLAVSGDLPVGTLAFPGAGMLPTLVCVLMILFGVLLIARAGLSPPFAEISWSDLPHALRVIIITAIAVALYQTLGFIITMTLLLFALIALEGRNLSSPPRPSASASAFERRPAPTVALKTPLEQGLFGF